MNDMKAENKDHRKYYSKIDQCRRLHKYLKRKLQEGKFRRVGEVLRLGIDDEKHLQKTMLIITKEFKENEWIKEPREKLVEEFYKGREII